MIITIQILIILALLYVIVVLLNKIADKNNEIYLKDISLEYNRKRVAELLNKKSSLLIEIAELKKPAKRKVVKKSK